MENTRDWLNRVKAANTFEEIVGLLQQVKLRELPLRSFAVIDRAIRQCGGSPRRKIAYLSNFVLDMLPPYLSVFAANQSMALSHYVGGYDQYFQEILDPKSGLGEFAPDVVFLALSTRRLHPELSQGFAGLTTESKKEILETILKHLEAWYEAANGRFGCQFLIANFPLPSHPQLGVADQKDPFGEMTFYYELNRRIYETFAPRNNVLIFDAARLCSRFGMDRVFDPKMYYMAKIEWSDAFLPLVSDELLRLLIASGGVAKKCLVLDLDNTLWGGVVGEEGPRGVKVGIGDPVSEAFADFQRRILSFKERGILLAICSKNNPEDVTEVFAIREDMPLKMDDFAAVRVNWENKSANIAEIAAELNIGMDSMVFVDDNPAECELIRQMLPQVTTIHLPKDPVAYPSLMDDLILFEKAAVLEADRKKTQQYAENRQRSELKKSVGDLTAYLHSLETEITIRKPAPADLDRVHQLFTKTNQFNVTTIRYSPSEIDSIVQRKDLDLYVVDATDKFGNLGTVGLYLLRHDNGAAAVDSFILSCRAMGRGIESAVMNHLKRRCFEERASSRISARYNPTPKNKPVSEFFEGQHFRMEALTDTGEKIYQLPAGDNAYVDCSWVQIRPGEE